MVAVMAIDERLLTVVVMTVRVISTTAASSIRIIHVVTRAGNVVI